MTEQNLNSAERLLHYATELEQEAAYEKPTSNLPSAWPNSGTITFDNVSMAYRPGLPNVLRSVQIHTAGLFKADDLQTDSLSFNIQAGEAVGICGRTGKSSILLRCMFLTNVLPRFRGRQIFNPSLSPSPD